MHLPIFFFRVTENGFDTEYLTVIFLSENFSFSCTVIDNNLLILTAP